MDERLRQLQQETAALMKKADQALTAAGVPYYLAAGSVLGAMRHQGFIPWDDDMDIALRRRDLSAAETALAAIPGCVYEPTERHLVPDAPTGHLRAVKNGLPLTEWPTIDVFALDNTPDNPRAEARQWRWAKVYHQCVLGRPPHNRGPLARAAGAVFLTLCRGRLRRFVQEKAKAQITRYNADETARIANLYSLWGRRETMPAAFYGEPVMLPFEGMTLPVPSDPDGYLTALYGDWRTPPPPSERVCRHRFLDVTDTAEEE